MNKKRFLAIAFLALSIAPVAAQYRVDRLITAGRSALYYEDYVLSIKYFNLAIGAKPYLYEPWYYRSVAKFSLDDYTGAESDATEALHLNPYINDIYDLRAICRIRQSKYDEEPMPIPCNMINCFCMYSDYVPLTLDEWIDYYLIH